MLCYYNNLHSSGKALFQMLDHCCRHLLPFSQKSISEVGLFQQSQSYNIKKPQIFLN
uniref:Uncharacterized protein n=1 Tax=Anguilla anguilla TaxID=7936 RepID=A0A0E9WFW7_ANGAN